MDKGYQGFEFIEYVELLATMETMEDALEKIFPHDTPTPTYHFHLTFGFYGIRYEMTGR